MIDTVIAFDVWSDFAHFKKNYTTTSPVSFGVPPRTTVTGLIAAIIGLGKKEYYEYFKLDVSKISLRVLNPIKRIQLTESLVWTKDTFYPYAIKVKESSLLFEPFSGQNPHILVRIDFIKNPKYRIYFWHKDGQLMDELEKFLKEHKSVYTPYLGISELIANFSYVGRFKVEQRNSNDFVEINSIIPFKIVDKVDVMQAGNGQKRPPKIMVESMPIYINADRVGEHYGKIIYEEEGKPIRVKLKHHYWNVSNGENIVFFSEGLP